MPTKGSSMNCFERSNLLSLALPNWFVTEYNISHPCHTLNLTIILGLTIAVWKQSSFLSCAPLRVSDSDHSLIANEWPWRMGEAAIEIPQQLLYKKMFWKCHKSDQLTCSDGLIRLVTFSRFFLFCFFFKKVIVEGFRLLPRPPAKVKIHQGQINGQDHAFWHFQFPRQDS